MTEQESLSAADKLKRHFSSRVLHQSQQVVDLWQQLPDANWSAERLNNFTHQVEKLLRFAQRFEANKHKTMAHQLLSTLATVNPGAVPDNSQLEQLNDAIINLSKTALRRSDNQLEQIPINSKNAVYIALNNKEKASLLTKQMHYFRITASSFDSAQDFSDALSKRHPSMLIIDTDFGGEQNGLLLADQLQDRRAHV